MLARLTTFAIDGLASRRITVEVDLRTGLPGFTIVGRGDAAVRESRERVHSAVRNSGFEFPNRRVTVNLAPAYLPKSGPGYDLATACGLLVASGQVPAERVDRWAVFGELSLGGELRPCGGALAVAEGARRHGLDGLIVPRECAAEAGLVNGVAVAGVGDLAGVAAILRGDPPPQLPPAPDFEAHGGDIEDLRDVRGHAAPIRALTIAAAGGHKPPRVGPPRNGETMVARRLGGILPPLTRDEALEVTRIHSLAGLRRGGGGLITERPFRTPHHTISFSGLVGGGAHPSPGEASLAHHGVLFLDELSEFARSALEALRQPLEDRHVTIVRGQRAALLPTSFMLVAATNPCPCGRGSQACECTTADHNRHRRRLSGPLLDRIDLHVGVERPDEEMLTAPPVASSAAVREEVLAARERQAARLGGTGASCNADMPQALVPRASELPIGAREALRDAYADGTLSARGHGRVLRVARTIADLERRDRIEDRHVLEAIALRRSQELERREDRRAAA
jgi:magnesium chelatase family protein